MGQDVAFESAGIFEPMFGAVLDSTDRIVVFEIRDFDFLGDRIFGQSQDVVGIVDMCKAGQAFDALSDVRADTCLDQIVFGGGGVLKDIVEESCLFGRCRMALEHDAHQVQDVRIAVGIALSSMKIQSKFDGQFDGQFVVHFVGLWVLLVRFHRFRGASRSSESQVRSGYFVVASSRWHRRSIHGRVGRGSSIGRWLVGSSTSGIAMTSRWLRS